MKYRAAAKGEAIIRAESHLADLFASGEPTVREMTRVTGHLGAMRGQIRAYDRLRGYLN